MAAVGLGVAAVLGACKPSSERARAGAGAASGAPESGDSKPSSTAASASDAERIEWLISNLEKSDATFIRNGTEHSGGEAAGHLRSKLAYAGGSSSVTLDQFIDKIASTSSASGRAYQVKKADGTIVNAAEWFRGELAKFGADGTK